MGFLPALGFVTLTLKTLWLDHVVNSLIEFQACLFLFNLQLNNLQDYSTMGMKGKDKDITPVMSDEDNVNSSNASRDQSDLFPNERVTDNKAASCTSPDASSNLPSSANSPEHHHSGLTSGPRIHTVHGDRPNSAPPHHLEKLSGVILRTMGDRYQTSTYGQTLRLMGDQMTFENEIRRALSYSDLDRLQNSDNR